MKKIIGFFILLFIAKISFSQNGIEGIINKSKSVVGSVNGGNRKDTIGFEHRNDKKDSIAITYKYLDSIRINNFDTSINDFDKYFSIPSSYQVLGNNGAAAYNLVYTPFAKAGWDAGHHAFDVYRYTLEGTKFYKTNKPFTQLGYQLASGKEQMVKVLHTQSPRKNWSFGADYRLINAPGFFITQNTNHKNYRIFSNYQSKRKRYTAYFVLVGNAIKNAENGGIKNDTLLQNVYYKKRYYLPTNLGNSGNYQPNPFKANVTTGNIYKDVNFFYRHSYDVGKRDSVEINDSTTEYLFYPKLRFQHTFIASSFKYNYLDLIADSATYKHWYDTTLKKNIDTFKVAEKWNVYSNDFSLISYPDTKNSAQFLSLGATIQNIKGWLKKGTKSFYNFILHGEYRNKTRNKKWDLLGKGEFYVNGLNAGDYNATAFISRLLSKKRGYIKLYFTNTNRTPSFIYNNNSPFNFKNATLSKKENILQFGADVNNSWINIGFKNYTINNLAYFTDYYHTAQSNKVINLLQLYASKKIKLNKRWNYYVDAIAQITDAASPIKVPLIFTRNRLAYEGVFYKNLNLSMGLEARYYTPYKANNYSPVMGQFMPQDTFKLSNLPDVTAFFHFRIKSFTAYIRGENLNTGSLSNGFSFTNNNFAAPHYPTQGLILRLGIQWGFVN